MRSVFEIRFITVRNFGLVKKCWFKNKSNTSMKIGLGFLSEKAL